MKIPGVPYPKVNDQDNPVWEKAPKIKETIKARKWSAKNVFFKVAITAELSGQPNL
jgi:hypothetical protein